MSRNINIFSNMASGVNRFSFLDTDRVQKVKKKYVIRK